MDLGARQVAVPRYALRVPEPEVPARLSVGGQVHRHLEDRRHPPDGDERGHLRLHQPRQPASVQRVAGLPQRSPGRHSRLQGRVRVDAGDERVRLHHERHPRSALLRWSAGVRGRDEPAAQPAQPDSKCFVLRAGRVGGEQSPDVEPGRAVRELHGVESGAGQRGGPVLCRAPVSRSEGHPELQHPRAARRCQLRPDGRWQDRTQSEFQPLRHSGRIPVPRIAESERVQRPIYGLERPER